MSYDFHKAVNAIALAYASQASGLESLAEDLLRALGTAEANGLDINSVWASIAVTNNWADREAGIDGDKMPKTLQNYRSLSRKALSLGVSHVTSGFAAWRKAISAADKLAKISEEEKAPKIEAIDLNNIELPSWIERASGLRAGMTEENIKAFDKALHHAIENFMQKKIK